MTHEARLKQSAEPKDTERLRLAELRGYLPDIVLATSVLAMLVLMWCGLSIAGDVRASRHSIIESQAAEQAGLFNRFDEFLRKMSDGLVLLDVLSRRVDTQLTHVRSEARQSSVDSNLQTAQATRVAAAAVTKTDELITAVQDKPAANITVAAARPEPTPPPLVAPPVVVAAPPTIISPPEKPAALEPQSKRGIKSWLRNHLWPFSRKRAKNPE